MSVSARDMPRLAAGEEDQVPRLAAFRAAHPGVVILLAGTWPKAWVDGQKIEHPTLRELLDELGEMLGEPPQ